MRQTRTARVAAQAAIRSAKKAVKAAWKKVGITFNSYDRGKSAGLLSSSTPFSDEERKLIQRWMD